MQKSDKPGFFQLRIRWSGLTIAAGVIACLASGLGLLAAYAWPLDLFSHFRCQYLWGLVVCAALIRRHRTWAIGFFLFAILNLALIAPRYFGKPAETPTHGQPVRALLSNVNTESGDVAKVGAMMDEVDADIVVLQEVNSKWMKELTPFVERYRYSVGDPRADNFGIALYSKLPILEKQIEHFGDAYVPTIIAKLDAPAGPITVIATHPLPPTNQINAQARNNQLREIGDYSSGVSSPVLLIGDLNCTPWSPHFSDLLQRGRLFDSGRGFGVQPSWPTWLPILMIPIDHCLHSRELTVRDRRLGPYVSSDHLPLIVELDVRK